jgi:hypothetical protein
MGIFTCAGIASVAPGGFTVTVPLKELSRVRLTGEGFCWVKRVAGRVSNPTTTSTRRKRSYLTVGLLVVLYTCFTYLLTFHLAIRLPLKELDRGLRHQS